MAVDFTVKSSGQPSPSAPRVPDGRKGPAAVVVAHGMGQQIPFQTLDDLAQGLLALGGARPGGPVAPPPTPAARTVALGDERLSRLELTVSVGGQEREVHVYEAYWAPLTEGCVTLRDVAGFLMRGGFAGVRLGTKPFRRWLFGEYLEFPAPVRTVFYLVVALGTIVALAVLSALIVAITAARAPLRTPPGWLSDAMFRDVTTVLNALIAGLAPLAVLMGGWTLGARVKWRLRIPSLLTIPAFVFALWSTWAAAVMAAAIVLYHAGIVGDTHPSFFSTIGYNVQRFNDRVDLTLGFIVLVAVAMVSIPWLLSVGRGLAMQFRTDRRSFWATSLVGLVFLLFVASLGRFVVGLVSSPALSWSAAGLVRHGLAWPLVMVAAAVVRRLLIQYVGDVAAYIQPQRVDRFFELRKKIKDTVWKTVHAVYRQTEYQDIVLVGHSLGSVVMYDVLNRLLIDRAVDSVRAPEVATRTRLLLTFGSPLDKTAFIFSTQSNGTEAREALAASVQPLITNAALRPPWINIYSPADIISGSLEYYDLREGQRDHAVHNVEDTQATTFLAAHVEYWRNPKVFEAIVAALG